MAGAVVAPCPPTGGGTQADPCSGVPPTAGAGADLARDRAEATPQAQLPLQMRSGTLEVSGCSRHRGWAVVPRRLGQEGTYFPFGLLGQHEEKAARLEVV